MGNVRGETQGHRGSPQGIGPLPALGRCGADYRHSENIGNAVSVIGTALGSEQTQTEHHSRMECQGGFNS